MKSAVLLAAVAAVAAFAAHAGPTEMPGGLWEMKMKMDMPGLPPEIAAKMGDRTMTHCVKPGERKWADREKGPMDRGDRKCEQTELKSEGNTISWKMKCADGTSGEGTVVHNGKDSYKMESVMNSPKSPGPIKMVVEGKKIADTCEK